MLKCLNDKILKCLNVLSSKLFMSQVSNTFRDYPKSLIAKIRKAHKKVLNKTPLAAFILYSQIKIKKNNKFGITEILIK